MLDSFHLFFQMYTYEERLVNGSVHSMWLQSYARLNNNVKKEDQQLQSM